MPSLDDFSELNLPAYDLTVREDETAQGEERQRVVFDPIRSKYVRLTPEEWVRQHFLQYLIQDLGYPSSLIAVEMGFEFQQMPRRADIVVHDRRGRPFIMAECKAPNVGIRQATFDQVSRYNRVVDAHYLAVTNGVVHYCWQIDPSAGRYEFLNGIPPFDPEQLSSR